LPAANDNDNDQCKASRCRSFSAEILLGGKARVDWEVRRERVGGERLRRWFTEESKNPNPVSGADPSIPRGLFHPNAGKVAPSRCAVVSAVLNLG